MPTHLITTATDARHLAIHTFIQHHRRNTTATIEHDPRWLDILHEAMGHQPRSLLATDADGEIRGYLPLVLVKSKLFGRFLVSLPYLNRAGIIAADSETRHELITAAIDLAEREDTRYLELRHDGRNNDAPSDSAITHQRTDKPRMVLDLPDKDADLWQTLGPKVRNQIRKGEKSDLTIQWGGVELVKAFYRVFAVNMRDLGTPVYPRRLFESILTRFPEQAELAIVYYQNAAVAGALLIHDRLAHATQVPSASCLRTFNFTNANMWMYHQLLTRAIQRGSHTFDFGRSTEGSGPWRFKKQWGATPQPTCWQYHLRHGNLNAMRPDHPANRRRIAAWQKLPVWTTRLLGPPIVRGIP